MLHADPTTPYSLPARSSAGQRGSSARSPVTGVGDGVRARALELRTRARLNSPPGHLSSCRACWHDEAVASDARVLCTVVVALLANLGIVVATSLSHDHRGDGDVCRDRALGRGHRHSVLLLVAQHRSGRPAAPSGLTPGREAYFRALLAAIGVFVVGAVLAVYEGVRGCPNPTPHRLSFVVAYVVLAVAFLLDLVSFLRARRQLSG